MHGRGENDMNQSVRLSLGTFSIVRGAPFAGLAIDETVVTVRTFDDHAELLGGRICGADTLLDLLNANVWRSKRPSRRKMSLMVWK